VTIEGLVGGYIGPGGKTILPNRMVAKLDMRLVPNMTPEDTVAKLKRISPSAASGDIEVVINGGMNEVSSTSGGLGADRAEQATYRQYGIEPLLLPRSGGSDPAPCSPANRSSSPPAASAWASANARTRRTSTT
jgi:acetylornithine deacetylase/succinyl-diaminopimelate desuccinylase-like protein